MWSLVIDATTYSAGSLSRRALPQRRTDSLSWLPSVNALSLGQILVSEDTSAVGNPDGFVIDEIRVGDTSADVTLTGVVPEPSSFALAMAIVASAFTFSRRRWSSDSE